MKKLHCSMSRDDRHCISRVTGRSYSSQSVPWRYSLPEEQHTAGVAAVLAGAGSRQIEFQGDVAKHCKQELM